jgi:tetratricopeptide (TPR) repeat protein
MNAASAEDARALAERAISLLQEGKNGPAIELFRKALALEPKSQDARFNLGLAYFRAREYSESLRLMNVPTQRRAEDYALIGANYRELGKLDDAVANMRKAVRIQPGNSDFAYDLALTLIHNNQAVEAVRLLETVAAKPQVKSKIFGALGMALFMTGSSARAEQAYSKAIRMEPTAADLHASLGDVYYGSGEFQKAAAEYSAAVKLDPGNPDYHNKAGRNLLRLDQTRLAAAEFESALARNPRHSDSLFQLGKIASAEGNADQAVSRLEGAVAADPNHAEAYYQLSLNYKRLGEPDKATSAMRRFQELKGQQ